MKKILSWVLGAMIVAGVVYAAQTVVNDEDDTFETAWDRQQNMNTELYTWMATIDTEAELKALYNLEIGTDVLAPDGDGSSLTSITLGDNPDLSGNERVNIPGGTTGTRPSGTYGDVRYNSTLGVLEWYDTDWNSILDDSDLGVSIQEYDADTAKTDVAETLSSAWDLGTPSAVVLTNASGTASININGTVGATTPAAGTFTTATATSFSGAGGGLTVTATGFDGNLSTDDNTLQEIAQALDDLSVGGTTLPADPGADRYLMWDDSETGSELTWAELSGGVADDSLLEVKLDSTNAPTDNYILSYDDASGGFTWVAPGSGSGDLLADGTVPLTANWDVGAYTITGTQFISDIAIGTAPFVVTSTTVVTNLNADTVDGESASAFQDSNAYLTDIAGLSPAANNLIGWNSGGTDLENKSTLTLGFVSSAEFEGSTADDYETTITVTDPTADRTITVRDDSGTMIISGDTFTGDVTGTLDTDGSTALTIASNIIDEDNLKADNSPTDNYILSYDSASGGFTWVEDATGGTIADDSLTVAKMANGDWGAFTITSNVAALDADSVDSAQYVNGSIDPEHLAGDAVTADKLDDDGNFTLTGTLDFGGASLEIPNGANPTVNTEGGIAYETDEEGIRVYDGSANRLIGTVITESYTIMQPDLVQAESDDIILYHFDARWYPFGVKMLGYTISTSASSSDTYLLEEWDDESGSTQTTSESIALSTATRAEDDGTLSDADFAADSYLNLNLDDSQDDISYSVVTFAFYVKTGD